MSLRPSSALPQPDFLRPAHPTGGLARLACASALLVLGVAAVDAWAAWQARQRAQDSLLLSQRQVAARDRPLSAARPAPAPGAGAAAPSTSGAWLQRLDRPWPALWAASEAASVEGIAWQSLDLRDTGQLRLQGQATDAGPALEAGRRLRGQVQAGRTLWGEVVVARIDRQDRGQRFEIQARLAGPDELASAGLAGVADAADRRPARPARP